MVFLPFLIDHIKNEKSHKLSVKLILFVSFDPARFSQIRWTNIKLSRPQIEIHTAVIQSLCRCETNTSSRAREKKKCAVERQIKRPAIRFRWQSQPGSVNSSSRFRYPQNYPRYFRQRSGAWVSLKQKNPGKIEILFADSSTERNGLSRSWRYENCWLL